MNFLKYVKSLRTILKDHHAGKRFVIGNSSADFDSLMGSLIYAFFMTNSMNVIHFPLIDCPQADMAMRFQTAMVMEKIGIEASDLLYTQMFVDLYQSNHTFYLYDHNQRPNIAQDSIAQIIDHHAIKNQIKCPHMITNCASAMTLMYYLYKPSSLAKQQNIEQNPHFCNQFSHFLQQTQKKQLHQDHYDPICFQLIMYGILLDSYNFDQNQQDRWIHMDVQAVKEISQILPKTYKYYTYEDLSQAKTDQKRNLALTLQQQKTKDFKIISYQFKGTVFQIHYSTILVDVRLFIQTYLKQLNQKMPASQMRDHEIHSFMFAFTDPNDETKKLQKYKLFNAKNEQLLKILENSLSKEGNFQKVEQVEGWRLWRDPSGKISRKSLDLYLKKFFKGESFL